MIRSLKSRRFWLLIPKLAILAVFAAIACGSETETVTVVETVAVKEQVTVPGRPHPQKGNRLYGFQGFDGRDDIAFDKARVLTDTLRYTRQ